MRTGPIILLVATVAFVSWIAPGLSAHKEERSVMAPAPASSEPSSEAETRREAWLTGGTVLERQGDGHFYADAEVDSRQTHFLVDTGATIVALTGVDARAIGLTWEDADLVPIGRGASGTVYGVPARLERIRLDGFEARNVDAAIIPEGLDVSLLGQSFLAQLRGVRIDGDRMVLGGNI
ncbi:retropepsin-like aspartic protease family protein [Novosphingobium mangrovi (ex Huang et al. 2023)]|uniref:TIGR02281 family clan AA aspartic protease n=1 Tax=Novosphingobium mangrovi (ex Huang et al. 2023) TaxID=2976432 RepID=A0ABT2I366_9SPHN|nr:TIGR02281 family clan AA aspartic protease [Novosphingobium mangrovi (ex Huang et al. 2023)]MCT2399042.1 TIGR02281 family clan AA aspartic protease [Novosphingobium mangrovi (ex Huang et al. 2023)]